MGVRPFASVSLVRVLMSVANPYIPPTERLQLDLGPFDPGRHGLLRVQRARQFSDSLRGYRIEIDGQPRGGIRPGRATEIPLEPGSHQLILRMDWFSSPPVDFTIRAGEMFTFACWSNIRGWRIIAAGVFALYYLVRRGEYLSVKWTNTRPAVVVEPS